MPPKTHLTLTVVMAAYNEADTVATAIERVLGVELTGVDIELVIVESNSSDGTRSIVSRYSSDSRVRLVLQDTPRGKGAAVREGFLHATGDLILIQDADLEYSVEDYGKLIEPIMRGDVDFTLGCRHVPGEPVRVMHSMRKVAAIMNVAHWVLTWCFNVTYGTKLRDPFTMYKVFRTECIAESSSSPTVSTSTGSSWASSSGSGTNRSKSRSCTTHVASTAARRCAFSVIHPRGSLRASDFASARSPTRATTRGRKGRGEDAATWDNAAAIFSGRPPAMRWTPDVVDASPSEHGSSVLTFPRP